MKGKYKTSMQANATSQPGNNGFSRLWVLCMATSALIVAGLFSMGLSESDLELGESTHVDYYDYYRRLKIDLCKDLPTLAETYLIDDILAGSTSTLDLEDEIDNCLNSDAFAELLGLWIDDFILPHSGIGVDPTTHRFLSKSSTTFNLPGGGTETIEYFFDPRSGGINANYEGNCGSIGYLGCREPGVMGGGMSPPPVCDETHQTKFESVLETVDSPYFQRDPVLVCPGIKWYENGSEPTGYAYSGTTGPPMSGACPGPAGSVCPKEQGYCDAPDDAYCFKGYPTENDPAQATYLKTLGGGQYCPQSPNLNTQCSCGPNLIWCMVKDIEESDDALKLRLDKALREEPANLVKYIVQNDADFRDIFNADYSVRSKRSQHYLESNQGVDPDLTLGTRSVDDFLVPTPGGAAIDPDLDEPVYHAFTAAMQDGDGAQVESGILTSHTLLLRQPTQPNLANTIYRFWTCDEVTPRIQGYSLIHDETLNDDGTMLAETGESSGPNADTQLAYYSPETELTGAEAYDADTGTDGYLVSPLYLDPGPNDVISNYQAGDESYAECYSCHVTVNPLAAFRNNWDDDGRYVPLSGEGLNSGINFPAYGVFAGKQGHDLAGLGDLLADSQDVIDCIIQRSYKLLTGEALQPSDREELETLRADFENGSGRLADASLGVTKLGADNYNIKNLYKSIVLSESYRRGF
jgi:hypothetical protein